MIKNSKKTCAIICTRNKEFSSTLNSLCSYFTQSKITPIVLVGAKSIFKAYSETYETYRETYDQFIFCHDDIILHSPHAEFKLLLDQALTSPGFVGPAGTTMLTENAVWWDQSQWALGKHSGMVFHGDSVISPNFRVTYYGEYRQVVVLDGLFLAANKYTLDTVCLKKPSYFEGNWDFYDIYYTSQAHKLNFKNRTIPILITHNSFGELAGRDSWHQNREAFIQNNKLPMGV